jgi:hypothetical protein
MGNEVNSGRFLATVDHIMPKRFSKRQIEEAWEGITGGEEEDAGKRVMRFLKELEGIKYRTKRRMGERVAK